MKKHILITVTLWLGSLAFAEKPNVIVIITDDQGYGDLACHGNTIIQTPNMDKLHARGVRLTDFHVGPTCAPSRSGVMTGLYGNRAGVWWTIAGCNLMRAKHETMAEMFKKAGYTTGMFGKWHLGDAYPYLPRDRGFDMALYHGAGGVGQTPDWWNNDYFDDTYFRNGTPEKTKGYCTDVWFGEAQHFIKKSGDKPFFVYISPNAPHSPFNLPKEYYDKYRDEKSLLDAQRRFYGMITNIDDNMGRLEAFLKKRGQLENTIVLFMTDNGTAMGYKTRSDKTYGFNAGMRGTKSSQYEGGHRVPCFIHWPKGNIAGGKSVEHVTAHIDLVPTLAELCGIEPIRTDGVSLVPLLENPKAIWPDRVIITDGNRQQQPVKWHECSTMTDRWRLVDGKELYDIKADPGQQSDIAARHPEVVERLRAEYDTWWDSVSEDFSEYEAYRVGEKGQGESVITAHDLHCEFSPWNQSHVRTLTHQKKPLAADGYYLIDVAESGTYRVELRRWPREAGLAFNETPPAVGQDNELVMGFPAGKVVEFTSAGFSCDALKLEQPVDMSSDKIVFTPRLTQGRKQLKVWFDAPGGIRYSALYLYVEKMNGN
jgi:arylsulfatase A-like enzyme